MPIDPASVTLGSKKSVLSRAETTPRMCKTQQQPSARHPIVVGGRITLIDLLAQVLHDLSFDSGWQDGHDPSAVRKSRCRLASGD